ncbi:MAG: RnfABCDGE type electron transport complex subunit G [Clostridiales Family XIII bacterium]|jgi:electron transport complex protein RnfG|nr:RnfABCDGE type electron transport complex subunit G [Clostridiales Family XIII bacterium]
MKKHDIAPTLALVAICLVVTAALVLTHGATKPIIAGIHSQEADEARRAVLPAASGFEDVTAEVKPGLPDTVASVFLADGESGYVVTVNEKGFGGTVEVMVGIGTDGAVTAVKVLNHSETPGLGTKAMTEEYLAQYGGASDIKTDKLNTDRADATEIDTITGATITSNTVYRAVDAALVAAAAISGGSAGGPGEGAADGNAADGSTSGEANE